MQVATSGLKSEDGMAKTYEVTAGAGDRRRANRIRDLQPYDGTDGTAKT